jgi:regulation of enolase protein 1 (concanavalin A-like superfamily)
MQWLNEPASWQRTGGVLTVSVDPGTDFWRQTGYGYIRDSGHVYGEVIAGDLDVSVRIRGTLDTQYDQAGIMLRADEQTWVKTGVEFFEGQPRLSTVLTLGRSSWTVTSLPADTDEITLRVARRGDAVEVRYATGDDEPPQLAALVFLPPGCEVLAGVTCAAPEGPGFIVTFHDLHIAPVEPEGHGGWPEPPQEQWAVPGAEAGRRWLDPQAAVAAGESGWEEVTAPGGLVPGGGLDDAGDAGPGEEPGWAGPATITGARTWAASIASDLGSGWPGPPLPQQPHPAEEGGMPAATPAPAGGPPPGQDQPVHSTPGQGAPGQSAPGQGAPGQGNDAAAQDGPAQDGPAQEAPGQEAPGQDAPGQDAPGRARAASLRQEGLRQEGLSGAAGDSAAGQDGPAGPPARDDTSQPAGDAAGSDADTLPRLPRVPGPGEPARAAADPHPQAGTGPAAREAAGKKQRSKKAARPVSGRQDHDEMDAAEEWISLLTTDPED